jgi:hypothetical protein
VQIPNGGSLPGIFQGIKKIYREHSEPLAGNAIQKGNVEEEGGFSYTILFYYLLFMLILVSSYVERLIKRPLRIYRENIFKGFAKL